MTIETTLNYPAIRKLLLDERVYRQMSNDAAPAPSDFPDELPGDIEYIMATDGDGPAAVFLLDNSHDEDSAQVHFCFHPRTWGKTVEIAQEFVNWMWREKKISRAIGPVPGYNRLALELARKVGFEEFTRIHRAVRKNGKAYDLILTKIERPAA